jgi:hypothetical protein
MDFVFADSCKFIRVLLQRSAFEHSRASSRRSHVDQHRCLIARQVETRRCGQEAFEKYGRSSSCGRRLASAELSADDSGSLARGVTSEVDEIWNYCSDRRYHSKPGLIGFGSCYIVLENGSTTENSSKIILFHGSCILAIFSSKSPFHIHPFPRTHLLYFLSCSSGLSTRLIEHSVLSASPKCSKYDESLEVPPTDPVTLNGSSTIPRAHESLLA